MLAVPAGAAAHGDPSGHYLETQSLYPAFTNQASQAVELQLRGVLDAVGAKGYPVKVAMLGSESDIPDEPWMLRTPQRYAERLGAQLEQARKLEAPLVVITPYGFGVTGRAMRGTRFGPLSREAARSLVRGLDVRPRATGDELARGAMLAVRRIAAKGGRPLPAHVPAAKVGVPTPVAPPGDGHGLWLPAAVFAAIFLGAASLYEGAARLSRRRRRMRPTADRSTALPTTTTGESR